VLVLELLGWILRKDVGPLKFYDWECYGLRIGLNSIGESYLVSKAVEDHILLLYGAFKFDVVDHYLTKANLVNEIDLLPIDGDMVNERNLGSNGKMNEV